MISDGLLFTISYGIGDPTVDGRLPPASAVDANLDLARERAFRNFAVEGRTRQTGTCEHGFDTDDPFEIGQASDSSVWLSQAEMAELFQTTKQSISLHVRNILDEGELEEEATVKENLTVQTEGKRKVSRQILLYNLQMILAVGFRVRSLRGMQFRRWASEALSEYLVKGFVMDDDRLKEPDNDYFEELLARIRDIRASEKLFYKKVLDIYATAVDYDPRAETSTQFFQTVQNKMHHAAHGQTAAETKLARADAAKPMMGLTSWPGEKQGRLPTKQDAQIAKNYLQDEEMETLNRITVAFLEFAEAMAKNRKPMHMVLRNLLVEQLRRRTFDYRGRTYPLSTNAIDQIVRELTSPALNEGLTTANEKLYNAITLGVTVTEFVDGKKHSVTVPIIDWAHPLANSFVASEEMEVLAVPGTHTRRPDIVGFVNGIPLLVIEAKRPDSGNPNKSMVDEGISQTIRNQGQEEIPHLFAYAHLLLSIGMTDGRYGTTRTPRKFWAQWREEEFSEDHFRQIKNIAKETDPRAAILKSRAMLSFTSTRSSNSII